jgi:hypothetical protein
LISGRHVFCGYRVGQLAPCVLVHHIEEQLAGGLGVREPAVVAELAGLQDQRECAGYTEAGRSARNRAGLCESEEGTVRSVTSVLLRSRAGSDGLDPRHDLTETTRAMAKRGSDDLKKLAGIQATVVNAPSI